jgi:glycosyltransferase involved in cell wall biosynthesis
MPILTICVPIYNVEKYLERCLKSLVDKNNIGTYQVILVDDCGTDESMRISKAFKSEYPEIFSIYQQPKNLKVSSARNIILDQCTTEYIMFVDSDDWLGSNAITKVISSLISTKPDLLVFDYVRVYKDKEVKVTLDNVEYGNVSKSIKNGIFSRNLPVTPWAKVFKTQLFANYRFRFNTAFQDLALIPVIVANSISMIYMDAEYCYRQEIECSEMYQHEFKIEMILLALSELAINARRENQNFISFVIFKNMVDNVRRFKKHQKTKDLFEFLSRIQLILNAYFPNWRKNSLIKSYISSPKKILFFKSNFLFTLMKSNLGKRIVIRLL